MRRDVWGLGGAYGSGLLGACTGRFLVFIVIAQMRFDVLLNPKP